MTIFVIDISNWQGNVDTSPWLSMNIHGGIAKALEGKTGVDKQWFNNKAKLARLKGPDFVPGGYHYMNHTYPAGDQCRAFLDLVPGDWIHALDVEGPGPLDVDGWFNEYRKHYPNKTVLLYTNEPMWRQISKVTVTNAAQRYAPCAIWIAGAYRGAYQAGTDDFRKIWSRVPAGADGGLPQLGFDTYTVMQYTGSSAVPGVSGQCDMGVAGSIDVLNQLAAENGGTVDMPLTDADVAKVAAALVPKIDNLLDAKLRAYFADNWVHNPVMAAPAGTLQPTREKNAEGETWTAYRVSPLNMLNEIFRKVVAVPGALQAIQATVADDPSLAQFTQVLNDKLGGGEGGSLSKEDVKASLQEVISQTHFVAQPTVP